MFISEPLMRAYCRMHPCTHPLTSLASLSAPPSSSMLIASAVPYRAARCSEVYPWRETAESEGSHGAVLTRA